MPVIFDIPTTTDADQCFFSGHRCGQKYGWTTSIPAPARSRSRCQTPGSPRVPANVCSVRNADLGV
jgi:hypothetical protein